MDMDRDRVLSRWCLLSQHLLHKNSLSMLRKFGNTLPDGITSKFDEIEINTGHSIDEASRKRYFKEFFRMAGDSAAIGTSEVEELICSLLQIKKNDPAIVRTIDNLPEKAKLYDFPAFVSILSNVDRCRISNQEIQENRLRGLTLWSLWQYCYLGLIPIHPDALPKQGWDLLIILLLVYSSFQVPYKLAFEDNDENSESFSLMELLDIALDVIFMLDVALCFLTSYYDMHGVLVNNVRAISQHYLKTWFLPDLGGSFPFDKVISVFLRSSVNVGALRVLKLVRMLKLLRAAKVFKALRRLGQREGFEWLKASIGISQSTLIIVFFAHVLGCFFTMIFVPGSDENWMYHYNPELQFADGWTRYITALYWAMISITTMGYGDIYPVTHQERLFCIFVAMIGAIVFSYCVGTISSLMTTVTGVEHCVNEKLQSIDEYFDFRGLSRDQKRTIKSFYTISWRKTGDLYSEKQIMGELANHLRKALLCEIGLNSRQRLPLFEGLDSECVGFVVSRFKQMHFLSNETVYHKGDPGTEAFVIISGTVNIINDSARGTALNDSDDSDLIIAHKGDIFGELALFPELAPPTRINSAVAKTATTAYSLSAEDISDIRSKYPAFVEVLQELCALRLAEHRMHGRACAGKTARRARGSGQPCKLKTMIAQLQRDLLIRKTRDILVPASGPDGSKVLSLFIMGSEGPARNWVSISCVVSGRGELLCFEHTTCGALRDRARSLGFFVPGKSTFTILNVEDVDIEVCAAQRDRVNEKHVSNSEMPHGCKVLLFECGNSNAGPITASLESMATCIYTWMSDDFFSLVYSFEQLGAAGSLQSIPLQPKQRRDTALNIMLEAAQTSQQTEHLSESVDCVVPGRSRNLRRLPLKYAQAGKRSLHPLPPIRTASSLSIESDIAARTASRDELSTPFFVNEESMLIPQSLLENLIGNLEWLSQRLEKNKYDTVHLPGILWNFLNDHAAILQNMINHAVSSKHPNYNKVGMAAREANFLYHRDLKMMGPWEGEIQNSLLNSLNDPIHPPMNMSVKIVGGHFGSRICPLQYVSEANERNIQQDGQRVSHEIQVPVNISNEQKWQSLSKRLVFGRWNDMLRSVHALPDRYLTMFDEIEKKKRCRIDEVSRKKYYKAFFRKACGSAAINAAEVEELVHTLFKVNCENLQALSCVTLDDPAEKLKLFDFPAFVSILCDVQHSQSANSGAKPPNFIVLEYCYRRLIPIHPDALPKQVWDLLIILLLVYSSFQVPYKLAFEDDSGHDTVLTPKEMLDIALDVIFMLDVALCFLTSYYDMHGVLVNSIWAISQRYLKTWFLPDLAGSFPVDKVIAIFLRSSVNVGALRILKLVRMLKLLRAAKVFKALRRLEHREGFEWLKASIGIIQSVLLVVFFAHVLGCFFTTFFVDGPGDNWMYHYNLELKFADGWTRYLTALYWAIISITTMGYGDIRPVTSQEQMFCIFVATTGVIVFSFCMGTISALATDVTGVDHAVAEKMQNVSAYIRFRKISKDLKIKVKSFYIQSWRKSGIPYNELELLNELPNHLRKDVLREIGNKHKQQIPILMGFENECIGFVLTRVKHLVFVEGDVIYQHGDHGTEAFFIVDGTICLNSHDTGSEQAEQSPASLAVPIVAKTTGAGDVFGELALFPELAHTHRLDTAIAKTFVTVLTLSVDDIPAIRSKYPVVVEKMLELCTLRLAEYRLQGRICASEVSRRPSNSSEPCKIKSIISQLQRNILIRKNRDILLPASGQVGSKVLSLFLFVHGEQCKPDWVSISCVVSEQGELLCFENNPMGAVREKPKSLGFFVSGCSTFRILKSEEIDVLFLSVYNGAKPHGCKVLVYDQSPPVPDVATAANRSIEIQSRAQLQSDPRELLLFSWLDDEFDSLIAALKEQ